ncbi:glycoside hydrolase family 16 protein [Segetibacter sp. 3557_3]|uniref:glycoside hydrolase family 16 protein n=1 Tax=Segetibacter sp. 3557_3 TaxID=2547429 RepID=UPI0010590F70|nr:glycoside hydrolase family 16 protein [Segetibacter sp. 3557_3]TDH26176.1 glycoside hydrolase family 16 protein [Segetibacter sp. 3557_3]
MKQITSLFTLGLMLLAGCDKSPSVAPVKDKAYELVWADEFDYSGLPKSTNWDYETGKVRNNEEQFYKAASLENSRVENGLLHITATYDKNREEAIRSASVITKGKVDFLYGRIEARVKMPSGKGAWPAVWTLGKNRETVGWPACGEIDIVEWLGHIPSYVFGSLHKGNDQNKDVPMIGPYQVTTDVTAGFHNYAIEWENDAIRFFFDDVNYVTYTPAQMTGAEWQQFSRPHYLLLNLAMGGKSGGTIDYNSFPLVYQIDYVRYYKRTK